MTWTPLDQQRIDDYAVRACDERIPNVVLAYGILSKACIIRLCILRADWQRFSAYYDPYSMTPKRTQ